MTTMGIFNTVSAILVFISIVILISRSAAGKKMDEGWGTAAWAIGLIFSILGLILLPLLVPDHTEYIEITNIQVLHTKNAVVIDLVNSPERKYQDLYKFDRYQSVMEIDSTTKFFFKTERSYYGIIVNGYSCWSNPPYDIYNLK